MGKLLLIALYLGNAITSIIYPWIGIIVVTLIIVLTPHNIWWWNFEGSKPVFYTLTPVILGTIFWIVRGNCQFKFIKSKTSFLFFLMWGSSVISYLFGPYVDVFNEYRFFDSHNVFLTYNKTILYGILLLLLIDNYKKYTYLCYVFSSTHIYMTYWANKQYLIYNVHGRLNGPAGPWGSIYYDENIFAMLLLATMPFVFYLALIAKNKVIKYALFFVLPFGWHAVFLTGSRGGLITLFIVSILISFRSLKGSYILGFLLMLMIAFAWQGGSIMKQRAGTIDNYSEDESAMGRIDAWSAAIEMAKAHPFTGVGFAAFGQAFSSFSNERPRVAHNTFFQLLGENGLLGACSFLGIILYPICKLFALAKRIKRTNIMADRTLLFSIEAILASLISFGVSAIFLSLDQYDIFYVLIVMANFIILYGNNRIFSGGK